MRRGLAAVAAVALLAGCGGTDVDRDEWRSDLQALGYESPDMERLADLYAERCDEDADALALFLAVGEDAGELDLESIRVNFRHACPERLDVLEEAVAQLRR